MRVVRIVQALALLVMALYLLLLHDANPQTVILPGLPPAPPALALAVMGAGAFLVGWLPTRVRLWQRQRELARLEGRIRDLEQHVPNYDRPESAPVIPDRDAAHGGAAESWNELEEDETQHPA